MQSNNLNKSTLRTILRVLLALTVLMPLGAFALSLIWLPLKAGLGFALATLVGMVLLTIVVQNTIYRV